MIFSASFRQQAFEDEEFGAAFIAAGKIKIAGGGVIGEGVAFDFDRQLTGVAETGSGGDNKDRAAGDSEKSWWVRPDLAGRCLRRRRSGRAPDRWQGRARGRHSEPRLQAVITRAEGDAGWRGGIEQEAGEGFQGGSEDEDAAAVLEGEEELMARWIIGESVGTAIEIESGDRLALAERSSVATDCEDGSGRRREGVRQGSGRERREHRRRQSCAGPANPLWRRR